MAVRFGGDGGRWLLPALFFLTPLITSVLPRTTPLFIPLIFLTLYIGARRRELGLRDLLLPSAALVACLLFSIYVFINASWALDQNMALGKAALLLSSILLVFAGTTAITTVEERQIRRAALAFVAGAAIGALYLFLELLTDGAIARAVMNSMLALPEKAKRIAIVKGEVTDISLSEFNQNATMLMFHLWPGLLVLSALKGIRRRPLMIALFFLALAVPILISEHDSSLIALLGSILVLVLARQWPRLTTRALAAIWCLGFALVLPLNFLAYNAELHLADPLPDSYKARVIIWEYTSERVLERPWLGIGMDSTPEMKPDAPHKTAPTLKEQPEGFVFKRTTAHHAHNIFLQSWYELGALGAILLAAAGALIVLRIDLLPLQAQPFAAATFAAFAIIAAFSWGMWQTWFMCAIALVPLYVAIASATVRDRAASAGAAGAPGLRMS